jgi:hypothetical protein
MIRPVARKNHSDEFRRQGVDLYEPALGATVTGIAADRGTPPTAPTRDITITPRAQDPRSRPVSSAVRTRRSGDG